MDATKWKSGIGAAVNERPLVLFLLIILVLAVIESILSIVTGISRLTFLLMAPVFSPAFHSTPDSLTIRELYLGTVICERPDGLNVTTLGVYHGQSRSTLAGPGFIRY
ncbi:MAG: hypothetical protein C4K48_09495 [Candidatus Thorarchaeota archaeon]|nr:MAG: hypothetical protein C4K48_09495 [Candidatus Thorarchaeota archaeon]